MPIPKKNKGEKMDDFKSRCMGDSVMVSDYPDESQRMAVCMAKYELDSEAETYEKIETERKVFDIDGVEIFEAGTWNGDTYSEKDLDDMVSSFNEIGSVMKPYLKLGHDANQVLLQKSGMPAAGWITAVRREGTKLLAKLSSVPEKIYNLIKNKAYGRISSEVYWNLKQGERVFPKVLKAAALLGGDTPAIGSLDDFIQLYEADYEAELHTYYQEIVMEDKTKDLELKIKELELKNSENEKKYQAIEAENVTLKAEKEKMIADARDAEIKSYIKTQMDAGKVLPSQEEKYFKLAQVDFESVKNVIENMPKVVEFEEKTKAAGTSEKSYSNESGSDSEQEELDKKAKEYMKSNKVGYREALLEVMQGGK